MKSVIQANAGRFVPFVMKYGGTVGAGMKRLLLPTFLRELRGSDLFFSQLKSQINHI